MAATVERPVAQPAAAPPVAFARAEGLELLGDVPGSGYKQGASLVRRADGQMVQLGPLMYSLLEAADGTRDHAALAAAMSERIGRGVGEEHVAALGEKACAQGLLSGSEENAPPRMNPLLALRWKVLFTDPNVTRRITAPFVHLFRSWLLLPMLAGFLVVAWFVLIHKGVAAATAQAFDNPELLLLVLGLVVASAAFHEIGHASACRYGGGRPGGIGAGIYLVWPAFYTDVTDAYRLPRRARLRTDLGGLYFNAIVAVVTLVAWAATHVDALLLIIALQMLEMVKQLSPMIRADGYHILADATGVPDLYAHIGPTLKRLLPWHRDEPSALTGRARVVVTIWVLVIVPVLIALSLSAIMLLPKLAASTWESGSHIVGAIPDESPLSVLASIARLFALALPVLGVVLMAERLVRSNVKKANAWSAGSVPKRAAVAVACAALVGLLAWAWWPSGQYQPVRASDRGTLLDAGRLISQPVAATAPPVVRAAGVAPVQVAPGRHLAVALIPRGGATKDHPAIFVIKDHGDGQQPAIIVSDKAPDTAGAPTFDGSRGAAATPPPATAAPAATSTPTAPAPAAAIPFILPDKPRPTDSQALAVNTKDGAIVYDVAYSLVTVEGGAPVDEENSAYALASCKACKTVAVSFQLVLVVGQSDKIMPINVAEALNYKCPYCLTTAIAKQIVISLRSAPSDELIKRLAEELKKLDAIDALGDDANPADVLNVVNDVQQAIEKTLQDSGQLPPPKPSASATPSASASPDATASPDGTTMPVPVGGSSPTTTATTTPTPTPASPTPTPTPTATATPSPTPTATPAETPTAP
jgi:putative peptide zinc metalloprotease protein